MKQALILVKNLTSGGAEKQSVLLAKVLDGCFHVHYIVLNAKYREPKYLKLLEENPEVQVVAFHGNLLSRFSQFCRYLKQNQIDFIFSYLTAANFYSVLAAKITGIKYVFTGIRNAYLPNSKAFVDRLLCNHMVTKAILNCHSGEKYFATKGFKREKMVVIPNCFENITPYFAKCKTDNIIRIISVGRFVAQKDYFTALDVIAQLCESYPKIRYQIVGYGELEEIIHKKVEKLGIDNFVEVHINPNNISKLLENADIYLSTSIFEGTSNSIMEAMNANLPIIATNVGDNYKLIEDKKNGFLTDIKDVKAITSAISYLIVDNSKRLQMGKYSKQHLLDHYSVDKFRERYLQLIEKYLN